MKKLVLLLVVLLAQQVGPLAAIEPLRYNHPGLTVDLGVGLWAWPMPMDWDDDGDYDLVVSCPDKPYNGTYLFENIGKLFKPGVKIGKGMKDLQVSHVRGGPRVLRGNTEYLDFVGNGFGATRKIHPEARIHKGKGNVRFNVWSYVDYDGDDVLDLMVGADDWGYFGWDDGYDDKGKWKRGPLHGYVYIIRNTGTSDKPKYAEPQRIQAAGRDVNVYGNPMPNLADFDGDGDLDLICAEFLDGFTYFANVGSRAKPEYAEGRYLRHDGEKIRMHVQMITPTAIDWDKDGDVDLVCGDEDGRVALVENTGEAHFLPPRYFQQQARDLKFGALVTPVSVDWDGDGDEDLVCGNTAGNIALIENLDGGNPPKWARPELLEADGKTIRIQAGPNGSIQGPAEAKWGYTTLDVADWNHDGRLDLVVNSIWGRVVWYENTGTGEQPRLAAARAVTVQWPGAPPKPAWTWWKPAAGSLATQWRTTPVVEDWNEDGLNDLVMLDHEGYLALFAREKRGERLVLLPGRRIFAGNAYDSKHRRLRDQRLLQLNASSNGRSGRRKFCIVDWDGDGLRDLLVNSASVHLMKNLGQQEGLVQMQDRGPLTEAVLAGHTTSPTVVDWNRDKIPDLLIGAEDGRFYFLGH